MKNRNSQPPPAYSNLVSIPQNNLYRVWQSNLVFVSLSQLAHMAVENGKKCAQKLITIIEGKSSDDDDDDVDVVTHAHTHYV